MSTLDYLTMKSLLAMEPFEQKIEMFMRGFVDAITEKGHTKLTEEQFTPTLIDCFNKGFIHGRAKYKQRELEMLISKDWITRTKYYPGRQNVWKYL